MRTILDQLRKELESRGISFREVERLLGGIAFRHKLKEGAEGLIRVEELVEVLDAAGIDKIDFFARLAGLGGVTLAIFGRPKKDHWTRRERLILCQVGKVEERGGDGFAEVRTELRRIELLRDEDPKAAEAAAWKFLAAHRAPGALVGALAILAVEAPRPNAVRLFSMAFELLGPDLRSAAGVRVIMAMGRCLASANLPHEALKVFVNQALPMAALYGTLEEQAWVTYSIGLCASATGDLKTSRAALEKTLAIGNDRLRFASLQLIAAHELNCGDPSRAADMYDDLVSMPYFEQAEKRARVSVSQSRMTALFLCGRLAPQAENEFREVVEATRGVLDLRNQLAAVFDFALFLYNLGKVEEARDLLKAELWNVADLEDVELQQKFAGLLDILGIAHQIARTALSSRPATTPCPPHSESSRQQPLSSSPRSRARGPKE